MTIRTGNYDDDLDRIEGHFDHLLENAVYNIEQTRLVARDDILDDTRAAIDTVLECAFGDHVLQIGDAVLDYVKGSIVSEIVPAILDALEERLIERQAAMR